MSGLRVPIEDYAWPMRSGNKPYEHQRKTVMFKLGYPRNYDFSEMGTGKTLSALWTCDFLMINEKIKKVLVLCTLSNMYAVWGNEIFFNFPHRKYVVAHGKTLEYRAKLIASDADFVIMNHDGIVNAEAHLLREKFDVIIIDELTAFKNHKSNRSKTLQKLVKGNRVKGIQGMTADPRPNSALEVFGQAKIVNPDNPHLPRYYTQYRQMVETQVGPYTFIPTPNANIIASNILQPCIRFIRDECLDIPDCQYFTHQIPFTAQQRVMYEKMKNELIAEYDGGLITAINAASKMIKLLQIAAGTVKGENGEIIELDCSTRDDWIMDKIEESGRDKIIIACAFRASIERLTRHLQKYNVRVAYIHGDVDAKKRAEIIRDFQEGDLQVLIGQPQAMAHGITLTAACTIIWHSLIASGEFYKQFNGRVTRAGQKRKQMIHRLIGSRVEKRFLDILTNKELDSKEILQMFQDLHTSL